MNEQLTQWLMKELAAQSYEAISTEVEPNVKEASHMAKFLVSHPSWEQTLDSMKRKLSDNIMRKTSNDMEVAFNRGGLHALESLKQLVKRYALVKDTKEENEKTSVDE